MGIRKIWNKLPIKSAFTEELETINMLKCHQL